MIEKLMEVLFYLLSTIGILTLIYIIYTIAKWS